MTIRAAILGASGYTGAELARILSGHPDVEVTHATSERYAGQPLSASFPHLRGSVADLVCEPLDAVKTAQKCDVAFCALPHKTSMGVVPGLLEAGLKVVDLSADFRLQDRQVYEAWYGVEHTASDLIAEAAYGLPELNRDPIRKARLVANPGCYPTAAQLALAPLAKKGLIDLSDVIVDAKSGVTGAGRSAKQATLYSEVADGFKAYSVGTHRHAPEIEQELSRLGGQAAAVQFTPHLIPQLRGILATCYVRLREKSDGAALEGLYRAFYRNEPFIRILSGGSLPNTAWVRGSNQCDIALVPDARTGRLIVLAAIDNLIKGASGAAVQNMNLMLGLEETRGLLQGPLFP